MNYLMIPITNSNLKINDTYLHAILKEKYPEVYFAIANYLLCDDDTITYYEELLFEMLNNYSLPYYIIIKVDNNNQLFEIESNSPISVLGINLMDYKANEETVATYLDNSYVDGIINLIYTSKKVLN